MDQEEIFRLLLLTLLAGNADAEEQTTFGRLNNILIIGLLLELGREDADIATTTTPKLTTF